MSPQVEIAVRLGTAAMIFAALALWEWQAPRRVGELLHMAPTAGDVVQGYEPGHAMWLHDWGTFAVEPIDRSRSRVIVRTRRERGPKGWFLGPLFGELPHFIMERRMLLGIRDRAERRAGSLR